MSRPEYIHSDMAFIDALRDCLGLEPIYTHTKGCAAASVALRKKRSKVRQAA